jgi:hypothetical protein
MVHNQDLPLYVRNINNSLIILNSLFTFFLIYCDVALTLSNPIFLPPTNSPALIYFGQERGWWITCDYPTVLKEKNRKSVTCTVCWLKSVLHEEKHREQERDQKGLISVPSVTVLQKVEQI